MPLIQPTILFTVIISTIGGMQLFTEPLLRAPSLIVSNPNYVKKIVPNYGKTYHPVLTPDDAKLAFGLTNENMNTSSAL